MRRAAVGLNAGPGAPAMLCCGQPARCRAALRPRPRSRDEETNQTVIEGMGELHLEIIVDRLRREFKVECDVGAPQVRGGRGWCPLGVVPA